MSCCSEHIAKQNKACPITLSLGACCCALAPINLTLLSQCIACLHVAGAFAFGYGQYEKHTPYTPHHDPNPISIAPKRHSAHHTPTGVLYSPSQTTSLPLGVASAYIGGCHLGSTHVAKRKLKTQRCMQSTKKTRFVPRSEIEDIM